MLVNGKKTKFWPQELIIVKINGVGYVFQYALNGSSVDWMSITNPESSK